MVDPVKVVVGLGGLVVGGLVLGGVLVVVGLRVVKTSRVVVHQVGGVFLGIHQGLVVGKVLRVVVVGGYLVGVVVVVVVVIPAVHKHVQG